MVKIPSILKPTIPSILKPKLPPEVVKQIAAKVPSPTGGGATPSPASNMTAGGAYQGALPLGADLKAFQESGLTFAPNATELPSTTRVDVAGMSLKDRQELADARARQAGITPRLLEPESGAFSARRAAEIAAGLTGLDPSVFLEKLEAAEAGLDPSQLQQELMEKEGGVIAPELVKSRVEAVIGKPEGRPDAVEALIGEGSVARSMINKDFIEGLSEEERDMMANLVAIAGGGGVAIAGSVAAGVAFKGLIGNAYAKLVTVLGAKAPLAAKVAKGTITAGAVIIGLNLDEITDAIIGREDATELQGAINTVGQMAPTISGIVDSGGMTRAEGIARVNSLETDLWILEARIQQASILDPRVEVSGQYVDVMMDIADQQSVIEEIKAKIISGSGDFGESMTAMLLQQIKESQQKKKEEFLTNR